MARRTTRWFVLQLLNLRESKNLYHMEGSLDLISCVQTVLNVLDLSHDELQLSRAQALLARRYPRLSVDRPALIELDSSAQSEPLFALLRMAYPFDHPIALVEEIEHTPTVRRLALSELAQVVPITPAAIYLPPLSSPGAVESFQGVVAHLRAPDGCPWDRKQTHRSLRQDLLEETCEVLDALDRNDLDGLREELGDVLLAVLMQAQIAQEAGEFTFTEVVQGVYAKIVHRHPHVFDNLNVDGVDAVLRNWEAIKKQEKARSATKRSPLDGVPKTLPALTRAQSLLRHARASVSTQSDHLQDALDAFMTGDDDSLGDLLFELCRLAQARGLDAESTLREANRRFEQQFDEISP